MSAERDIVLEVSEEVKREVIADVEEWVCSIERGSSGLFGICAAVLGLGLGFRVGLGLGLLINPRMRLFVRVYTEASFLGRLVSVIPWGPLSDDVNKTKVIIVVNLSCQHAVKIYLSRATGWQFS